MYDQGYMHLALFLNLYKLSWFFSLLGVVPDVNIVPVNISYDKVAQFHIYTFFKSLRMITSRIM